MNNVVIVESPAKAKTINKYLGPDYTVLASYGHIRDLPSKDGSVDPDDDFKMDWETDAKAQKRISEITKAVKSADNLFLATDPDREGEAISWHIREVLNNKKVLGSKPVRRVVFNEITKPAILDAFEQPRELDQPLIDAYLARRALDYLVGFTLSPVLWRKLPGSRSAGRVQSVALRIICDRETEIENFNADEYWTVKSKFETERGTQFSANLTHLDGIKLDKLTLGNQAAADKAKAAIQAGQFNVGKIERKKSRRNPPAPFTTSTLQQEASRKLYFGAKKTMQVAQRLYEGFTIDGDTVGLITYMRTDGTTMADEAINACRNLLAKDFGDNYVPASPRVYKTKAKNAQEAHEAIRPTDIGRKPKDIASYLDQDQLKLYTLIWKRTLASQMEAAVLDQVGVDIETINDQARLRATGSVIAFDGFYRLYREGLDDSNDAANSGDDERILPELFEAEALKCLEITPEQHSTQPPPRYSEASLVKTMEELGIGRPSTYASIISVLQDRNYVKIEKRRFLPEDRGRFVTTFLSSYFERYVEYGFTAALEDKLDDISGGRTNWKSVLKDFWKPFKIDTDSVLKLTGTEVIDRINDVLGPHFFRPSEDKNDQQDPRQCPSCDEGKLVLKPGRHGSFIGCSNYPECRFTTPLRIVTGKLDINEVENSGPKELGQDPETGFTITLRKGPYGFYVQKGEQGDYPAAKGKKAKKPKRGSLTRAMDPAVVDLDMALAILSLPKEIGEHPETRDMILAAIGPFGPYLKYQGNFYSLKGDDDVLSIGLNRAVTVIADAPKKEPAIDLGKHPKDSKPIIIKTGRWGPFVQHGKTRANLPKDMDKTTVTLEAALEMLALKQANGKTPKKKAAPKKEAATKKKATAKKTPKKKTPKKKTTSKTEA